MEVIFQLTKKYLPGFKPGILRKLSFDIHMVIVGLKPCLLIDTIAVSGIRRQIEELITHINSTTSCGSKDTIDIKILTIAEDYLLVNMHEIVLRIKDERYYINISSCLELPIIMDNSNTIKSMINNISAQLQNVFTETSDTTIKDIIIHSDWNITTIFGILLDYPVVYWYSDMVDVKTCLPHKDLINYQIINNFTGNNSLVERNVYSFTIPACVINDSLERYVNTWVSKQCECGKTNNVILKCKKTKVNLSSVLL